MNEKMTICKACGTNNRDGAGFCKACGATLEATNVATGPIDVNWVEPQPVRNVEPPIINAQPPVMNAEPPIMNAQPPMGFDMKPLEPMAYVGYLALFTLVPFGFIAAIVFAASSVGNINRKKFAIGYLYFLGIMIALYIVLILILSCGTYSLLDSLIYGDYY